MISLCTVVDKPQSRHFKLFLNTLLRQSSIITHVYVAIINNKPPVSPRDYIQKIGNITINYFDVHIHEQPYWISFKHSLGLHRCLDRVKTEYVLLSDPDILFLQPKFDQFYVDTFERNNLNILGIQMYKMKAWSNFLCSYGSFPSIHNCLIKTKTLPEPEMFQGKLQVWRDPGKCDSDTHITIEDNYYLICGCIPEYRAFYPYPTGAFDTGCKLYIWNYLKNGRWLTFCPGVREVPANNWMTNVQDIAFQASDKPILYHQGGIWEGNTFESFAKVFSQYFGDPKLL